MNRDKILELIKDSPAIMSGVAAEYLADEILASQWISVEDELPEPYGNGLVSVPVLIWHKHLRLVVKSRYDFEGCGFEDGEADKWQPLPAPPEN
jgi:hypothetical protein